MAIDKILIGNKLKRCRVNLQKDIEEIEILTGINKDRIKSLENGLIEPTGDEILIFSDVYLEDYRYFISNEKLSASEKVEVMYRKFGGAISKKDRETIQEFIYLCENEQYVSDLLQVKQTTFSPPIFQKVYSKDGVKVAYPLRKALGYNNEQLYGDIFSEFRKIGIHVFRKKLDSDNISGLFIKHPTAGKCILINYDEDIFRQNFTLAHEVGHALMDGGEEFNISTKSDNTSEYREMRANNFASSFLIPEDVVSKLNSVSLIDDIILQTALKLKVNTQPLLIALKNYGIITKIEYNRFSQLKVSREEKIDHELQNLSPNIFKAKSKLLEMGLSSYYVRRCHDAYLSNHISSGKLAEMLLVSLSDLPSLLSLFNLSLQYEY